MRIPCPFCGPRASEEFAYLGDAKMMDRPLDGPSWEAVFLRDNPPGRHRELWRHEGGCGAWLVLERDVTTHEIFGAELAERALAD